MGRFFLMPKEPRPTKGVPAHVFKKELQAYLARKEASPGQYVKASFDYNGTSWTFERGKGPYNSGYQIKNLAGQAAKSAEKRHRDNQTPPTFIERLMLQDLYDVAAKRNLLEGRTGNRKLEIGHQIPRAKGGPHLPWNTKLQERGENIRQGDDNAYSHYQYEPMLPEGLSNLLDIVNGDDNGFTKATKIAEQIGPPAVSMAASVFNEVNQYVADNNGGEDIFDSIPNGSAEERKVKNKKVNGDHVKNNGHNGNGFGDYISNTINGAARALNGH